jgi:hypothetical protein
VVVVVVVDLVVVVFEDVVLCVVVVTGGVRWVVVDFVVVRVVVVTGATGAGVVATGAAVVVGAAAVAVVVWLLCWTARLLRWAFLWCTRLCAAAATDEVVLRVVDVVALVEVVDALEEGLPPVLPQPARTRVARAAGNATFIHPPPLMARGLIPKANNG